MKIHIFVSLFCLLFVTTAQALGLNGFTGFSQLIRLNCPVSGVIKTIHVQQGQRVSAGDTLIELDQTPYQIDLKRAQASEQSLLPAVETARLELERAEELYDRDSLSQVALKSAQNVLAEAEGAYQIARADRMRAKYNIEKTVIYAPVNARVLKVHANEQLYVEPLVDSDPVITLIDSRHMLAVALIKSEQWNTGLIGKKATVTLGNKVFEGNVSYLGLQRQTQSSGLPAYEVHVSFRTDDLIPAEMPVTINIMDE